MDLIDPTHGWMKLFAELLRDDWSMRGTLSRVSKSFRSMVENIFGGPGYRSLVDHLRREVCKETGMDLKEAAEFFSSLPPEIPAVAVWPTYITRKLSSFPEVNSGGLVGRAMPRDLLISHVTLPAGANLGACLKISMEDSWMTRVAADPYQTVWFHLFPTTYLQFCQLIIRSETVDGTEADAEISFIQGAHFRPLEGRSEVSHHQGDGFYLTVGSTAVRFSDGCARREDDMTGSPWSSIISRQVSGWWSF